MTQRIFIGLEISGAARTRAADYAKTLRESFSTLRVGWEKPEKLHLTLKFIGEIENAKLRDLVTAVEQTAREISAFKLQLAATGAFPNSRRPRVLWIGVKGETSILRDLHRALEENCANFDFPRETRDFKPHLTIARPREPENARALAEHHSREKFEPIEFEVSEIVIFESVLQPTGSIYQKTNVFSLQTEAEQRATKDER